MRKPTIIMYFSYVMVLWMPGQLDSVRILGIFPAPLKSHFSCNEAILKSLHAVGHQVTMITPFGPAEKVENFTYIDSSRVIKLSLVSQTTIDELSGKSFIDLYSWKIHLATQFCHGIMNLLQESLNSPTKLYDIIFMELIMDWECYLLLAEKLQIPVIGTLSLSRYKLADDAIGLPNSLALPLEETNFEIQMSMIECIQNMWYHLVKEYFFWKMRNIAKTIYREHFSKDILREKELSLVFYNNHPVFLPRIGVPNVIDIGGIHIPPANPLPKDIQTFIDEAKHGAILFTFGTIVKSCSMTAQQKQSFLAAFASIPQRVIWKFEERIENLPKNIMISSWLPQRDILEHKNVIAFMTHCGISGIYEAMITGTPVVTIPLFGDQRSNAAILRHRGVGVGLNLKTITKEGILDALNHIINDTRYYQRMQEFSRAFQDRPMTPREAVVYWTEYVVRHNGAPHLKALGTDMPFHKYLMLDIIALVLLLTGLFILTVRVVSKKIYSFVSCARNENKIAENDSASEKKEK